jgi:hypothetical protein
MSASDPPICPEARVRIRVIVALSLLGSAVSGWQAQVIAAEVERVGRFAGSDRRRQSRVQA